MSTYFIYECHNADCPTAFLQGGDGCVLDVRLPGHPMPPLIPCPVCGVAMGWEAQTEADVGGYMPSAIHTALGRLEGLSAEKRAAVCSWFIVGCQEALRVWGCSPDEACSVPAGNTADDAELAFDNVLRWALADLDHQIDLAENSK